jgi:5'-3' exonuclease
VILKRDNILTSMGTSMRQVILIDGKNAIYRHGMVNPHLARGDGFPTGALHGCLNSMLAIAKRLPKASFVWVWDGDGETWRHKYVRENVLVQASFTANLEHKARPVKHKKKYGYKANREHKKEEHESKFPEDPKARASLQIPQLRMILERSGFRSYQIDSLEGDDLIAILTRYLLKHGAEVIIHSGDKDFYQLLKHKHVRILKNIEGGTLHFMDRKKVKKKFQVSVRDWIKYRAWTGDPTDNIPHLKNVGPSVAQKLLAAGLDPSKKFSDLPFHRVKSENWDKFNRFFEPNGLERTWAFVEQNYMLCKLVSRAHDERLPEKIQDKVEELLSHVHFRRDMDKVNAETYRRISFVLSQYQLKYILTQRDLLWKIK